MLGTMFCNLSEYSFDLMARADQWTAPLFATFFVLSGAELDLGVFTEGLAVVIGLVFILFRSLGKYYGAMLSSALTGCSETVRKYLGITLLPQAGVALGMCATAARLGGHEAVLIRNLVLFSVLIYELTGPIMTQRALLAAGEIKPVENEKKSRERFYAKWLKTK